MQSMFQSLAGVADHFDSLEDKAPGDPRSRKFEGPWLQQQLVLSIGIGVFCFLLFSLIRRKSPALFAPRTKLKGFTSHTQGIDDGIFSWIWPTIKTEEIKILHMVGLDAAILLSFFKMSFWVFFFLSLWYVILASHRYDCSAYSSIAGPVECSCQSTGIIMVQ